MDYKKIENPSYNLHLIKTNKFKTIFFKISFRNEVKKEEITMRNFLFDMLITSCKKYPTKKLMNIKKLDLYDLKIYGGNRKIGNHISSDFCMSLLDPRYVKDDLMEESLQFLKEIIFNPNIKDNMFNIDMFNIIKNSLKTDIISLKEYPKYYSILRLKEEMSPSEPFSYNMDGYLDFLEEITPSNLVDYYNNFINNNLIDIYVVGNIDFYDMEKLISKTLNFCTLKSPRKEILIDYKNKKKKINNIIELGNYKQSRLLVGYCFKKLTDIERKYTMFIYSIILGASPDSRLFKNIREIKSLTYDIDCSYNKNDNIFVISAGIDSKNKEITLKAIKHEINEIKKGNIKDEEIENAKELMMSSMKEFGEYPSSITEYYFSIDYLHSDIIETAFSKIKEITKEDIVTVSKKVQIDTIYLLKEEENENN